MVCGSCWNAAGLFGEVDGAVVGPGAALKASAAPGPMAGGGQLRYGPLRARSRMKGHLGGPGRVACSASVVSVVPMGRLWFLRAIDTGFATTGVWSVNKCHHRVLVMAE